MYPPCWVLKARIQKHRGKPILFHDKCPGFFYVHYTTQCTRPLGHDTQTFYRLVVTTVHVHVCTCLDSHRDRQVYQKGASFKYIQCMKNKLWLVMKSSLTALWEQSCIDRVMQCFGLSQNNGAVCSGWHVLIILQFGARVCRSWKRKLWRVTGCINRI